VDDELQVSGGPAHPTATLDNRQHRPSLPSQCYADGEQRRQNGLDDARNGPDRACRIARTKQPAAGALTVKA